MVPPRERVQCLLDLGKVVVALVVEVDVQSILEAIHEVQVGALVLEAEQLEELRQAKMVGAGALGELVHSQESARNLSQVLG